MMRELLFHKIIKANEPWNFKHLTNYPITTTNPEVNLLSVLLTCELFIHNIIKRLKHNVWTVQELLINKQNNEVNIPPVLIMWEVLIYSISKKWSIKKLETVHKLSNITTTTEETYLLHWWCVSYWFHNTSL